VDASDTAFSKPVRALERSVASVDAASGLRRLEVLRAAPTWQPANEKPATSKAQKIAMREGMFFLFNSLLFEPSPEVRFRGGASAGFSASSLSALF
jgi:hypothetical protein